MATRRKRPWGIKEWLLATSLFVTGSTGLGIVARMLTAGDHVARHYIMGVVRDSLDCWPRGGR